MADQNPRRIRVFISSTFQDMQEEREELIKRIFPQLRKRCEARGVVWGEVDLRWGIPDEAKAEGRVLPICLAEIQRCRPHFIGLLGERYGWVPEDIPADLAALEPWLAENEKCSVTELEILHGVLNNPAMAEHAFFYFRDPAYIQTLPEELKPRFAEIPSAEEIERWGAEAAQEKAAARRRKLGRLKQRIRESRFSVRENYPTPRALGELVLKDLGEVIDRLYPENAPADPVDLEAANQARFAEKLTVFHVGRKKIFGLLDEVVQRPGHSLAIVGEPGSGKSSLLASWVAKFRAGFPERAVVAYSVGATAESSDWLAMVKQVTAELLKPFMAAAYQAMEKLDVGPAFDLRHILPRDPVNLRKFFEAELNRTAPLRPVIVLDGLDHLVIEGYSKDLPWLPSKVPDRINLIVSTAPGPGVQSLVERGFDTVTLDPLSEDERSEFIWRYLKQYSKSLNPEQTRRIVGFAPAGLPLYLKLLLEELRQHGDHFTLDRCLSHYLEAQTVSELYSRILSRFEGDFESECPGLVGHALSLLWASRRGLSEPELLGVLGQGENSLPHALWSPLHLAAESFMADRQGLLGIMPADLRYVIRDKYAASEEKRRALHRRLADNFLTQGINNRTVDELPWQLARAEEWTRLRDLLADPAFFRAAYPEPERAPRGLEAMLQMVLPPKPKDRGGSAEVKAYWTEVEAHSFHRLVDAYRFVLECPEGHLEIAPRVAELLVDFGYPDEALAIQKRLEEHLRDEQDKGRWAKIQCDEAVVLMKKGDLDGAMAKLKEAEPVIRQIEDGEVLAACLGNQGSILQQRGQLEEAFAIHKEVERVFRMCRNRPAVARALMNQAWILSAQGQAERAFSLFPEAERILREFGDPDDLAVCLGNQAVVFEEQGDLERAESLAAEEEEIARRMGNAIELKRAKARLGSIRIKKEIKNRGNQPPKPEVAGDFIAALESASAWAKELRASGDFEGALARLKEIEASGRASSQFVVAVASLMEQSRILVDELGRPREALKLAEEARLLAVSKKLADSYQETDRLLFFIRSKLTFKFVKKPP